MTRDDWEKHKERLLAAMQWVSDHLETFTSAPVICGYSTGEANISFGYHDFGSVQLRMILELLPDLEPETSSFAGSRTQDFRLHDPKLNLNFSWSVWKNTMPEFQKEQVQS